jgi:hypothetical protein
MRRGFTVALRTRRGSGRGSQRPAATSAKPNAYPVKRFMCGDSFDWSLMLGNLVTTTCEYECF